MHLNVTFNVMGMHFFLSAGPHLPSVLRVANTLEINWGYTVTEFLPAS